MKNNIWFFLVCLLFLTSQGAFATFGPFADEERLEQKSSGADTSLLALPDVIIKIIGKHSGNMTSLKATCRKLRAINFPIKSVALVSRRSPEFQQVLDSDGELDISPLKLADDISCLDMYQLAPEDFRRICKPNVRLVADQLLPESVYSHANRFIQALNKKGGLKIKELIIRASEELGPSLRVILFPKTISNIERQVFSELGIKITLIKERNNQLIDSFFRDYIFTEEQSYDLLRMVNLAKRTDGPYYPYDGVCALGVHVESLMKVDNLVGLIDAYKSMTANDAGYDMFMKYHHGRPFCNLISLIDIAHRQPALLEVVVFIHSSRLYYGNMGDICNDLQPILHGDTYAILRAFREFIPDFTLADLAEEVEEKQTTQRLDWQSPYEVSQILPLVKGSRVYARRDLFQDLLTALAKYPPESQFVRVKKLFAMLRLEHIAELINENLFSRVSFYKKLWEAFGYAHDLSPHISAGTLFNITVDRIKNIRPDFNPLTDNARDEFELLLKELCPLETTAAEDHK